MVAGAQGAARALPDRRERTRRPAVVPAPRRATATRRRHAAQARLTRLLAVFVVCLTVLAVGRVALTFAVVQKTMATEALVTRQRTLAADNAELVAEITRLSSMTRVRSIAQGKLQLAPATRVVYLKLDPPKGAKTQARRTPTER
jgi:cell division protein FtsL